MADYNEEEDLFADLYACPFSELLGDHDF